LKIAIFIADEGYGHAMRQKNIIHELIDHVPYVDITVYGKDKIDILYEEFGGKISYVYLYSYIMTMKDALGNLENTGTKECFMNWYRKREAWVETTLKKLDPKTNLIISDSVPQVSEVAKRLGIKQINIQHFSWDWLYLSLYGKDEIYRALRNDYERWGDFIFPPLTPVENLKMYPNNSIDLIVNRELIRLSSIKESSNKNQDNKFILLMNNGTKSLSNLISKILINFPKTLGWTFMLRSEHLNEVDKNIALERDDVKIITGMSNTHLSISSSDIVLARGGYNIISELIALNKKSLIIEEKNNPEIVSNLNLAKKYKNLTISNQKNAFQELSKLIKSASKSESQLEDSKISCIGASQVLYIINKSYRN
tara:strand:+ start:3535 stop:4638 length:1104 start_codon:yes stop_codon:yes gene_type:complete